LPCSKIFDYKVLISPGKVRVFRPQQCHKSLLFVESIARTNNKKDWYSGTFTEMGRLLQWFRKMALKVDSREGKKSRFI
jgi:hypothetical protein